jgi:alpha(1,3/1,4) fucosyltransferase
MAAKFLNLFAKMRARTRKRCPSEDVAPAHNPDVLKICATKVWPAFTLDNGFWEFLLHESFGAFQSVQDEAEADLVLVSVFPHAKATFPGKTIAIIWENIRPNYDYYRFSISFDFDDYGGRNCRLPNWYEEIKWSDAFEGPKGPIGGHGHEERIDIERLMVPRKSEGRRRPKFCCLVTSYRDPHRALAVEALSKIETVDVFGGITGAPLCQSKYEFLREYRFNLCFENSIFPGYYTEKAFQAWVAGCVPLYFSDPFFSADFNPDALVNRINSKTLEVFVETVRAIDACDERLEKFRCEPLLRRRPSLEPAVAFLRRAASEITSRVAERA